MTLEVGIYPIHMMLATNTMYNTVNNAVLVL